MCKVNALGRQLWVRKTGAPCQWKKANVNKPDVLETVRKMSCYSSLYIICHMTPQLNLLLPGKRTSSCWYPGDLDRGKTTQQKGVRAGTAFLHFFHPERKWLPTASWPRDSGHPAWSQDLTPGPGALERTQIRTDMQPQVIINGKGKWEKAVPSYTNTSHAFCICLSCRCIAKLFL